MKNEILIKQYGARNRRLERRGINYRQYLQSDQWKQTKEYARSTGKFEQCFCCSRPPTEFHHIRYTSIFVPSMHERARDLRALCRKCHEVVHYITEHNKHVGLRGAVRYVRRYHQGFKLHPRMRALIETAL